MTHRTLNPKTAFGGDGRESPVPKRRPKNDKLTAAITAWKQEFPTTSIPHYYGSATEIYAKLAGAGWKFSTRYGWRKMEKRS